MRRAGVAAAVLVLGACSSQPAPTPTPTPSVQSYTCIDDGLRKAGECSKSDYDKQQAEQATFAEAQKVYNDFTAERNRLIHAGGATEATPQMRALAEDPYLGEIVGYLKKQHDAGRIVTGELLGRDFAVERSITRAGAVFSMRVCEDGTETSAISAKGEDLGRGRVLERKLHFKRSTTGELVVFAADGEDQGSCG